MRRGADGVFSHGKSLNLEDVEEKLDFDSSSIVKEGDENDENKLLRNRIKELEDEKSALEQRLEKMEAMYKEQTEELLKEMQRRGKRDDLEESEDEKSNMVHIKEIFKKYIRGFPLATKDHERLCHVLFSMMDMANELDEVNEARSKVVFA